MSQGETKEPTNKTGRSKRPCRFRCDRFTAIVAVSALLATVALVAIPVAVNHWSAPAERGVHVGPLARRFWRELDWAKTLREVNNILAPGVAAPTPDAAEMAARLGNLGPDAIPVIVAMVCGVVPAPEVAAGTMDQPIHPGALAQRENALLGSLRHFRSKDVIAHILFSAPDASEDERIVFARLLGDIGTLEAQDALLEVLDFVDPAALQSDQLQRTVETAIQSCAATEPAAVPALSKSVAKHSKVLLPLLARAVGGIRGPESAAFLARLLGKSLDLDIIVLAELGRVTDSSAIALSDSQLSEIRRLLDHYDSRIVRAAMTVLGKLCDRESFGAIIPRLADNDRLVCGAAHWSLRSMARVDLGDAQEPWLEWLGEQESWWQSKFPALCENLRSEDPTKVFAALSDLNRRPFFKHELAKAIGPLASGTSTPIAMQAIAALAQIGSTQASPWLIEALRSDDDRREIAWQTLRDLTRLDLALDHDAWSRALP